MWRFLRGPPALALLLGGTATACTSDSIIPPTLEPETDLPLLADATAVSPFLTEAGGEVTGSATMAPADLLADPLLISMMGILVDREQAERISAAIEALKVSLLSGDQAGAGASLKDGLSAVRDYARAQGTTDEEVLHLDAIELTLDEVEKMIEPVRSKDKNKGSGSGEGN